MLAIWAASWPSDGIDTSIAPWKASFSACSLMRRVTSMA